MQTATRSEITLLPVESLHPNPWNRTVFDDTALEELAASIKAEGIREPLLVRPKTAHRNGVSEYRSNTSRKDNESSDPDTPAPPYSDTVYEIASGNRRWLAAQKAGIKEVPCRVQELSDEQVAEDNITMNIQREDIPPLELARMIQEYMANFNKSQADAARTFGKSRAWASLLLGFLTIDPKAIKVFSALNTSWVTLTAMKPLPQEVQRKIASEVESGQLKLDKVVKRCRQLTYGKNSKGGFSKRADAALPPDPMAAEWPKVREQMMANPSLYWEVQYDHHALPGGEKRLGWFFFAMPVGDESDDKQALADWFTQMGDALRDGTADRRPQKADGRQNTVSEYRSVGATPGQGLGRDSDTPSLRHPNTVLPLSEPRFPTTPAEGRELEAIALNGSPRDVYAWIFGPDAMETKGVPFKSWAEAQMEPLEGMKFIIENIRRYRS